MKTAKWAFRIAGTIGLLQLMVEEIPMSKKKLQQLTIANLLIFAVIIAATAWHWNVHTNLAFDVRPMVQHVHEFLRCQSPIG